ncbi:MAG: hypothetical protein ABEK03_07755 [Candidatus Bipolaricaulia bacterium]
MATVRQRGWTRRRQQAFLRQYGSLLRQAMLSELGRRFGAQAIHGLRDYLTSLERGEQPNDGQLAGRFLELAQDVWQAVCLEIFRAERNTIMQYDAYCRNCQQQGRTPMPFKGYLWGLVSLKVRQQIPRHRQAFDPVQSPPVDDDAEGDALNWEDQREAEAHPAAEAIALADPVDGYWEGLLRCDAPDPSAVAQMLELTDRDEHRLCWACSSLKRRLDETKRENLIAFVAFFVSQRGPEQREADLPERHQLCLEHLAGRYLRWEADVCARIFGKSIRKDRVIEQIQAELDRLPDGAATPDAERGEME